MTGQTKYKNSRKKVIQIKSIDELERICFQICSDNINMYVPWYIMASYAYYVDDNPILTDITFDRIANKILKEWETIEHFHKHYLTEDMLKAGTYLGDYPSRTKDSLKILRNT